MKVQLTDVWEQCMYMHALITCSYVRTYVHIQRHTQKGKNTPHTNTHTNTNTHTHHTHTYTHTRTHTHTHTHTHKHTHTHTHTIRLTWNILEKLISPLHSSHRE